MEVLRFGFCVLDPHGQLGTTLIITRTGVAAAGAGAVAGSGRGGYRDDDEPCDCNR